MRLGAVKAVAMVCLAGLGVAACGDDGGKSSSATTAAPVATTAGSGGATATTAGGAGGTFKPPSGKPWSIVVVVPLSGATASFYTSVKPLYTAMVKYINDNKGGFAGRPGTIEFLDNAGVPAQGVTVLQQYLDSHTPDMVMPGPVSAQALPVLPLVSQKKLFSLAGAASAALNDPTKYPTFFPVVPTTDQIESGVVGYAKAQGYKKLAFLGPDNASGHGAQDSIKKAAAAAGVSVDTALMDPTLVDATAQMSTLQAGKPDTLVLDGFGPTVGVFLKTKSKLKWNIPTLADETFAAGDLAQFASASDLVGTKLQFFDFDIKGNPKAETPLVKIMQQEAINAKVTSPLWSPLLTLNAFGLAKMAADTAGAAADDGTALTKALESTQAIPDNLVDIFFGHPALGLSATNHALQWSAQDFTWVNAGPLDKLLLVPGA
ncbi:MAG: hypothetical protein JWL70_39 [Acidimicrobiia bacterium]|nr:hypothetical protein [Acidimicrobiia bacterium]